MATSDKRAEVEDVEDEISSAEALLHSMGLQARSLPATERSSKQATVKRHRQELQDLQTALRRAHVAFTNKKNRADLFDSANDTELQVASMESRERLVSTTYQMEKNNHKMQEIHETIGEIEVTATEIMENLDEQRNMMQRMLDSLRGVNDLLSNARGIMNRMTRRALCNRMVMVVIILVLVLTIGLVVYFRFFYSSGGSSTNNSSPPDNSAGHTNNSRLITNDWPSWDQ
eukprot:TRINITY_DN11475_c0_g1_i1.p1 TRINITY_DN11475_c0_g1~~TRINITY_DN11475_c0_g1_i1.p1  ORF type:complete len:262 (-),score=36.88 TRINITY_DN11475_c0_g1_i1:158-847(-)